MADSKSGGKRIAVSRRTFPAWGKVFLAELADTSNVTASAKKAGVCTSVAYEARRTNPEFFRRWREALCEGYDNLEMRLLQRLLEGEVKPVAGAKRGTRLYDNATALRLLQAHRELVSQQRAVRDNEDADAVFASIDATLDKMRERSLNAAKARVADRRRLDETE